MDPVAPKLHRLLSLVVVRTRQEHPSRAREMIEKIAFSGLGKRKLSAPQRCKAFNAAMHNASFSHRLKFILSVFLQRHRCDALPCFSASPVEGAHMHTSPFGLCFHFIPYSPQWLDFFNIANEIAFFRKILVSVKFVSAILGPEMGAPILWTPGKNAFFLQEKPCP